MLWILAVAFSRSIRRKLEVKTRPGWPKGVYFHGRDVYRVGIVVANRLPRDRFALLVRFMVAGPLLKDAIEDLAKLPRTRSSVASWRVMRKSSPWPVLT